MLDQSVLPQCSWRQRQGGSQGQDNTSEGLLVVRAWTRYSQVLGIFFEEFEKVYAHKNDSFIKGEEEVQILGVLSREAEDQLSKRAFHSPITVWGFLYEILEQEEVAS